MARTWMGASGADIAARIVTSGGNDLYARGTATYEAMTTRTGSTQHTDLLDADGGAITVVTPDSVGAIRFQSVDGYRGSYWMRNQAFPSLPRWRIDPVNLADRISTLEDASGGVGVTDGDKGDIMVSSSGTNWQIEPGAVGTTELADNGVTLAKNADVPTATILGRVTAGTGDIEALTATQARTVLNVADGATANGAGIGVTDGDKGDIMVSSTGTNWQIEPGAVGTTELADGAVTPAKMTGATPRTVTGSSTLAIGDANAAIYFTGGSASVLTIPTNASVAFATDTQVEVWELGAGALTITAASGVTLNGVSAGSYTPAQYSRTALRKTGTNAWAASGGGAAVGTLATIVAGSILRCPWNGTAWTYAGTALTDRPSARTDIFFQLTGAPYTIADPAWMLTTDDRIDLNP